MSEQNRTRHELRGQRFGRLVVVEEAEARRTPSACKKAGRLTRYWRCQCDCGGTCVVRQPALLRNATKSCGCLHRPHGLATTAEYQIWKAIIHRCTSPKNTVWKFYGGRGIRVCERWLDVRNFVADMGARPSLGHSIDRIDSDGHYSPENCRWATDEEQGNNRRCNRWLTVGERTQTMAQWSRETGISVPAIISRLKRGWSAEDALTQPPIRPGYRLDSLAPLRCAVVIEPGGQVALAV